MVFDILATANEEKNDVGGRERQCPDSAYDLLDVTRKEKARQKEGMNDTAKTMNRYEQRKVFRFLIVKSLVIMTTMKVKFHSENAVV